jgi:hypothetical protein
MILKFLSISKIAKRHRGNKATRQGNKATRQRGNEKGKEVDPRRHRRLRLAKPGEKEEKNRGECRKKKRKCRVGKYRITKKVASDK